MSELFDYAYNRQPANLDKYPSKYRITVQGTINEVVDNNSINFLAAAPPDLRSSFSGSGFPFANASQAFDNTPNKGVANVDQGTFSIDLVYPNSYYVGLGSLLEPPKVFISYISKGIKKETFIQISDPIPFRSLTYPNIETVPRKGPTFYDNEPLPIRTQEQILRDSAYPTNYKTPCNFWGSKPPL